MMDLFSQNCPCCDSAKVDVRTRYTTQNNGTHSIYHCRSCDIYFSDTFATPMAGLRTPLSRIIEVLMERSSRFLWELKCGTKDQTLFEEALQLLCEVIALPARLDLTHGWRTALWQDFIGDLP